MLSVTINGQQTCAGQYVLAKGMFPFTQSSGPYRTVFSDPSLRPAKVHYFANHSFHANDSTLFIHSFAIVTWPLQHPLLNAFGKPYLVWCSLVYDTSSDNCIIPLENISSVLLTAHCVWQNMIHTLSFHSIYKYSLSTNIFHQTL